MTNENVEMYNESTQDNEGASLDNEVLVLNEILASKEKTEALIYQVKRLAKDVALQKDRQSALTQDIKDSAENLELKAATLKTFISAVEKGELEKMIQKGTSVVDVLTIIKEKTGGV